MLFSRDLPLRPRSPHACRDGLAGYAGAPSEAHPHRYDLPSQHPATAPAPADPASACDRISPEGASPTGDLDALAALAPACAMLGRAVESLGVRGVETRRLRTAGDARGYEVILGGPHGTIRLSTYDGEVTPVSVARAVELAALRWVARGYAPARLYAEVPEAMEALSGALRAADGTSAGAGAAGGPDSRSEAVR